LKESAGAAGDTYDAQHLLLVVELPVDELNYPLHPVEALEEINLSLEPLDRRLVGVLQ
jgi:hypothetical protein